MNALETKDDVQWLVEQLVQPLATHYSPGNARLHIGTSNSYCGRTIAGVEAFSRVLWGLFPLLAGEGGTLDSDYWQRCLSGIRNGTNPEHEEFWGYLTGTDQRLVEMAVFGLGLAIAPSFVWDPLSVEERDNLYRWLNQINQYELPRNNWHFFRVLVNLGFEKIGMPFDQTKQRESLDLMESFYLGDGWYYDGYAKQRDYYISFGFHYYGLVYSALMRDKDPERSAVYEERARAFSRDFLHWFAEDGSALPFGRSMTYRFAQVSFWSAMAFADVVDDEVDWGVLKGLVLRHLRWWFRQDLLSPEGLLTIGYGYANLNMAEGYNAPGSPYWALKTFLVLALPDDHPFWLAEEKPLPPLASMSVQKHAGMVLFRDAGGHHVFALTSGQISQTEHAHNEAKYAKFAYSNRFGFSVPKSLFGLSHGAFDSMLALSERDGYYRGRRSCETVSWDGRILYSLWKPWHDVRIGTWLIPVDGRWHVRLHRIETRRPLDTAEGGFAIPEEKAKPVPTDGFAGEAIVLAQPLGVSGMFNLTGNRKAESVRTEPNTNIMHSGCNHIPTLRGELDPGISWYGAAVFASVGNDADSAAGTDTGTEALAVPDDPLRLMEETDRWRILFNGEAIATINKELSSF